MASPAMSENLPKSTVDGEFASLVEVVIFSYGCSMAAAWIARGDESQDGLRAMLPLQRHWFSHLKHLVDTMFKLDKLLPPC